MEKQVAKSEPMPKTRLVPIVGILEAVSSMSDGELTIPDLADALLRLFDCDTTMIYKGSGYGLADPIPESQYDENFGYNARRDVVFDIFNSHFWESPDITTLRSNARDFMVLKEDAVVIAQRLWTFFFPEREVDIDPAEFTGAKQRSGVGDCVDYLNPDHPRYAPKLAAAVRAWQFVTEPNGKHPKQALTKWLREHAEEFGLVDDKGKPNETGIDEVAKVANWKPSGGAPKTPGE